MRIGVYCLTEGKHWDIGKLCVESARRAMPDVEVYHLTDMACPELAEPIRIPKNDPMGVHRIKHYCQLEGDWLFCDSDVLFRADVREVFNEPFDVAMASREGDPVAKTNYGALMPYNFGVVFSRSTAFWRKALEGLVSMVPENQEWGGEQFVAGKLMDSGIFKTRVLPRKYNHTPQGPGEDLSGVSILHMKGHRKAWVSDL